MARYIDADKLKIDMDCSIDFGGLNNRLMVLGKIDDIPTADVIERSKINEIIEKVKDESYLSYDDNPRHILDEECVLAIIEEVLAKN